MSAEEQQAAIDPERARLLAVISSMSEGVAVVDADGGLVLRNRAFEEMFGESGPTQMEDEAGSPIAHDDGPISRAARGDVVNSHFVVRDEEGNRHWYEARGRPIGDDSGAVIVIRDVTERSLQQLQDEFVAVLSHELRNPLAGVLGYLDLLHRRLRDQQGSREQRYAERALDQARRFAALVDELFDASRLRRGRMSLRLREVDLAALTQEAAEIASAFSEDHEIKVDPGRSPHRIVADPDRLQQVLLNLLSNAIRHAPDVRRIEVVLRRRGRYAEVAVVDHGPGLDARRLEELRQRLAQPTASLGEPSEGLGLGLYISHGIVQAHGGRLLVESTQGEGTTIRVRLPLELAAHD